MNGVPLSPKLQNELDRITQIELMGAPRSLVLDTQALPDPGSPLGSRLYGKLAELELDVVVVAENPPPFWPKVPPAVQHRLTVALSTDLPTPAIGVFGSPREPITNCYAWYVGDGAAPPWMHSTQGRGAETTDTILALFGTGLIQERAGAAFREAGAGRPIPEHTLYDRIAILDGISAAVAATREPEASLLGEYWDQLERSSEELLGSTYGAIVSSCVQNGAIAAAPPPEGLGEPNYQFFWPRDAAQTAAAIAQVAARAADARLRDDATQRLAAYTHFVAALPHTSSDGDRHLDVSRFTLNGRPLVEYGSPQLDGAALTALTVLATGSDPERALAVAEPYLDHLASPAVRAATFDVWEFSVGQPFHALNLARRALRAGVRTGQQIGHHAAPRWASEHDQLVDRLAAFDDQARGHLVSTLDAALPWMDLLSKLDAATVGSVLAVYDATDDLFNVDDPRVEHTMAALERHFARRWPVNHAWRAAGRQGAGIGRFPEDTNDGLGSTGGNPWPIVTLWAAQFHLRSVQRRLHLGASLPIGWRDERVAVARGYLDFVLAHVPADGMTEQIDACSGRPRGARRLAWAHAELAVTLLLMAEVAGTA
jgi:hypothetical protein